MRITIRVNDALWRELKRVAAATNQHRGEFVEGALREYLCRHRGASLAKPLVLPAYGRGGRQPGVDLDNSAALWELLDNPES